MSERGRPVPLLVTKTAAPRVIVLTARHHACEAMASFVLEGAIEQFLRAKSSDQHVARRCDLFAVPFVDVDGVWAGDQGKGRQPWDHNRDYSGDGSRYRAVAALRAALAVEARPMVGLDFHTPGLRGPLEERPYVVASGDPGGYEAAAQLLGGATSISATTDFREAAVLLFDDPWNSVSGSGGRCFAAWLRSRPNTHDAFTVEYPNAVSTGRPVYPDQARRFGAAILSGLLSLLC
ncbi:MAG: M14 family zinc carboxypeptidase [Pseudonocardiaceae bacterium]